MHSIYSSKLFQSSRRKDKIQAAIADPRNSELVTQLSKYIDVKTIPADDHTNDSTTHDVHTDDTKADNIGRTAETIDSKKPQPIVFHPATPSNDDSHDDKTNGEQDTPNPEVDDSALVPEEAKPDDHTKEPDKDVESATNTANIPPAPAVTDIEDNLDSVVASAAPQSCHTIVPELSTAVDEIYGTLNGREETKGVSRIMVKEDNTELWIHYEDSVNLNNVMSNVILVLNSCGYYYLQFNRLARSENAIVFEISLPNSAAIELPKEE